MKARTLTFYVEPELVPAVLKALDEEILPEYRKIPGFLGLVLLHADHSRREIVGISVWDGSLAESNRVMAGFRLQLSSIAGTAPTTETYDVLRFVMSSQAEEVSAPKS